MKTLILLYSIILFGHSYSQDAYTLKVDSLLLEGTSEYQIPNSDMSAIIAEGKLIFTGYNIFMEEKESSEYTLAHELGNGSDDGDFTYYRVNMYYNNSPVPDNDLEIYQYKNGSYKLIISSAAMITELYCTEK